MQQLVEYILTKLDLEYCVREKYIHCQSPFSEDNVKSSVIYHDDGCLSLYNTTVNNKQRLSLKEWTSLLGFNKEYVEYMLEKNNVPIYKFNEYKQLVQSKLIEGNVSFKKLNALKKELKFLYLSESEIIGVGNPKPIVNNEKYKKKSKRQKSKVEEVKLDVKSKVKIMRYMNKRKLKTSETIYPVKLKLNDMFEMDAVCILYPNGFKKYRLLSGRLRYMCYGSYQCLFDFRKNESDILVVSEGEIEVASLENACDYNLSALHNVNSVKIDSDLSIYKKIYVLLDYDKFDEVRQKVESDFKSKYNGELILLPKFQSDDKSLDFNDFLIEKSSKELKLYIDKLLKV